MGLGPKRVCPVCGKEHFVRFGHLCPVTNRFWDAAEDERSRLAAEAAEAARLKVMADLSKPPSRRGRPAKGADTGLTVERRKPWLALNWSRAKWYRKLALGEVSRFDDELPE